MNYPRLYVGGRFSRIIKPIRVSLTMNMEPLSCAVMDLPRGENIPMRSVVELFNPYGSAGMFRTRTPQDAYGDAVTTVELEHMACELADYLVKEKISEMMAASTAAVRIFSYYYGSSWKLGSVSALGSGNISVSINYDNVLTGLMSILSQKTDCMMEFDFATTPWTVSIVKKPTTVGAECRISRNITDARITYDDSEMCNRVYYDRRIKEADGTWKKDSNGDPIVIWQAINATEQQAKYGLIERTVDVPSDLTDDEAYAVAMMFLNEHKDPRVGVQIDGINLADITGESLDKFTVGKLLRMTIPEDGIRVEKNIRSMSWDDVYGDPRRVIVMIGDEEDTVVSFLHNLDNTGKGGRGGGGGGGGKNKDKEQKDYYKQFETWYDRNDELITMGAKETARNGEILKQAGMDLDRDGVLIYARNSSLNLQSMLDVQSNRINLVIEGTGENAKIKAAAIVAGINKLNGSFVRISADKINLDGYVEAKQLTSDFFKSKIAGISNLSVNNVTVNGGLTCSGRLTANVIGGMSFELAGASISNVLVSASVSGDTLTITNQKGNTTTFNRSTINDLTVSGGITCSGRITGSTVGAMSMELGGASFSNVLVSASVSGNTLTLTPLTGSPVTFSKATTLEGAWNRGTFLVSATPQGNTVQTTISGGTAYRQNSILCIPITSDLGDTGKEAYASLTQRTNCVSGLTRYGSATLYVQVATNVYQSVGNHVWYYRGSNAGLSTWYTFDGPEG